MSDEEEESRFCPYCGVELTKPYWQHILRDHKKQYEQKETWIKLFKDYKGVGMPAEKCITVISELFNATENEISSFLRSKKVL